MIEIELKTPNVNIIKETLNRIGICDRKKRILYPSCYVFEKDDKIFLIHFKEHFILTRPNAYNNMTKQDENRILFIASILKRWDLIEYTYDGEIEKDKILYIIKKSELNTFNIHHKIKL